MASRSRPHNGYGCGTTSFLLIGQVQNAVPAAPHPARKARMIALANTVLTVPLTVRSLGVEIDLVRRRGKGLIDGCQITVGEFQLVGLRVLPCVLGC